MWSKCRNREAQTFVGVRLLRRFTDSTTDNPRPILNKLTLRRVHRAGCQRTLPRYNRRPLVTHTLRVILHRGLQRNPNSSDKSLPHMQNLVSEASVLGPSRFLTRCASIPAVQQEHHHSPRMARKSVPCFLSMLCTFFSRVARLLFSTSSKS